MARKTSFLVVILSGLLVAACGDDSSAGDDPCDPNPCTEMHRTVCVQQGSEFVCECDFGYEEDDAGNCISALPCDPACGLGQCWRWATSSASLAT